LEGYEVVGQDSQMFVSVANNAAVSSFTPCPAGKQAIGGGFGPAPGSTNVFFLIPVASGPASATTEPRVHGWNVTLRNNSGSARGSVQFSVWAICVTQP
jgi:hypothetical protein